MIKAHSPLSLTLLAWLLPDSALSRSGRVLVFIGVMATLATAVLCSGAPAPAITIGAFLGVPVPVSPSSVPLWNALSLAWLIISGLLISRLASLTRRLLVSLETSSLTSGQRDQVERAVSRCCSPLLAAVILGTVIQFLI